STVHEDNAADLPPGCRHGTQHAQLACTFEDRSIQGVRDPEERDHNGNHLEGVGYGKGLLHQLQDTLAKFATGQHVERITPLKMLLDALRHVFKIGPWRHKHAKCVYLIVWPVSSVGGTIERDGAALGGVVKHHPGHWKCPLALGCV